MNSDLLTAVLDEIIPPRSDRNVPGAGSLGVGALVQEAAGETPELAEMLSLGLSAVDDAARKQGADGFAALAQGKRADVLREVEKTLPSFIQTLLGFACVGYYTAEPVLVAIKGDARPPHPDGYEMEYEDPSPMLGNVLARGRIYREC